MAKFDKRAPNRKFECIVYPDSTSYDCNDVLTRALSFKEYAYILHDRDLKEDGVTLKKAHIHLVLRQESVVPPTTIAHKLGIPENDVNGCGKFNSMIRYLCHIDDDDKVPYAPTEIVANFDVNKFLKYKDDVSQAKVIYDCIVSRKCKTSIELVKWCIDNSCWSEFRRGFSIWQACLSDMNFMCNEK